MGCQQVLGDAGLQSHPRWKGQAGLPFSPGACCRKQLLTHIRKEGDRLCSKVVWVLSLLSHHLALAWTGQSSSVTLVKGNETRSIVFKTILSTALRTSARALGAPQMVDSFSPCIFPKIYFSYIYKFNISYKYFYGLIRYNSYTIYLKHTIQWFLE